MSIEEVYKIAGGSSAATVGALIGGGVANAPASPGKVTSITDATSTELTAANLAAGVLYKLIIIPTTPTDFVRGVYKCAASGGSISGQDDGMPIFTNAPEFIRLPAGSAKLRVFFMRDTATPYDCKAYLAEVES
jgi:hypothetical protein